MGAHPRSRGENISASSRAAISAGSSPLTRGKPHAFAAVGSSTGLIPAHAGKTCYRARSSRLCRAHPRSRGENIKAAVSVVVEWGSSPLTRGKPGAVNGRYRSGGLIPAHAGKTTSPGDPRAGGAAHPRSRGENLVRGGGRGRASGLIPAHAGKTGSGIAPASASTAHPRSRGENRQGRAGRGPGAGSSPLTRGKQCPPVCRVARVGLIPAHAGKTLADVIRAIIRGAHPRSRGENDSA